MSNDNLTALQQTALSPACHLPADPADPASRAMAAADTAACVRILLNQLGNRLSQDRETAADALVLEVVEGAMNHILELLTPSREVVPAHQSRLT